MKEKIKLSTLNSQLSIIRGFTLVELLVIIAILGFLAGGVLVLVKPAEQFQKARDAQRKSDLVQIQKVLEQYYNDNGNYPFTTGVMGYTNNCGTGIGGATQGLRISVTSGSGGCIPWGSTWAAYNSFVPKDPKSDSTHRYAYFTDNTSDRQSYWLYAHLERITDVQACNTSDSDCPSIAGRMWPNVSCGGPCNYGVTSPNESP